MKLAVTVPANGSTVLAQEAERLGYSLVLAGDNLRSDAVSVLSSVAAHTTRIGLLSAVMQIPGRPPAMTALSAASLRALSGGRFRLGLGLSNRDVSEGLYGVPFRQPLQRTREYVAIVREALRGDMASTDGEPVDGKHLVRLQLPAEASTAYTSIYLAAVGNKNVTLSGEIGDGWIGAFCSAEAVAEAVTRIAIGRAASGREDGAFDVVPCVPAAIADDVAVAADQLRAHYAVLIGMGSAETNIYCRLLAELGMASAAQQIHQHAAAGDLARAANAVPLEFIDSTALLGSVDRIACRLRDYAQAGASTLSIVVSANQIDLPGRLTLLRQIVEAHRIGERQKSRVAHRGQ